MGLNGGWADPAFFQFLSFFDRMDQLCEGLGSTRNSSEPRSEAKFNPLLSSFSEGSMSMSVALILVELLYLNSTMTLLSTRNQVFGELCNLHQSAILHRSKLGI